MMQQPKQSHPFGVSGPQNPRQAAFCSFFALSQDHGGPPLTMTDVLGLYVHPASGG
jgi:hypothetical protein